MSVQAVSQEPPNGFRRSPDRYSPEPLTKEARESSYGRTQQNLVAGCAAINYPSDEAHHSTSEPGVAQDCFRMVRTHLVARSRSRALGRFIALTGPTSIRPRPFDHLGGAATRPVPKLVATLARHEGEPVTSIFTLRGSSDASRPQAMQASSAMMAIRPVMGKDYARPRNSAIEGNGHYIANHFVGVSTCRHVSKWHATLTATNSPWPVPPPRPRARS